MKKTKRKLPAALNRNNPIQNRREFIDADYLHKLNEEELEFYAKFISETVLTVFDDESDMLFPDKKREFYNENNARNRDAFHRADSFAKTDRTKDDWSEDRMEDLENEMVDYIDAKRAESDEIDHKKILDAFDSFIDSLNFKYKIDVQKHRPQILDYIREYKIPKIDQSVLSTKKGIRYYKAHTRLKRFKHEYEEMFKFIQECVKNKTLPSEVIGSGKNVQKK